MKKNLLSKTLVLSVVILFIWMSFIPVSTSNYLPKSNTSHKSYLNSPIPNFDWHFFSKVNITIQGTVDSDVSKIIPSSNLFRYIAAKYIGVTKVKVNFEKQGLTYIYNDVLSISIFLLIGETDLENGINDGGHITGWASIILIYGYFDYY